LDVNTNGERRWRWRWSWPGEVIVSSCGVDTYFVDAPDADADTGVRHSTDAEEADRNEELDSAEPERDEELQKSSLWERIGFISGVQLGLIWIVNRRCDT
jgi:hypothetical protein